MNGKILITGCAGFIGYHLCKQLFSNHDLVIGIDNLNNYYDVKLKNDRLKNLKISAKSLGCKFIFKKEKLENKNSIRAIFKLYNPDVVINLAAQAGVSYSLENPESYISSNILGFLTILEACKEYSVKNLIYASSSSVYGGNIKKPFSELDTTNHPISIYAATKISNELMAHTYSHLYNIPCIGLRFFTVYGPWGRPDMAPMIFANSILKNRPINVFNNGNMQRDFTYINDVVEVLLKLISLPALPNKGFDRINPDNSSSWAPHRIFNVGNSHPINLLDFINILEEEIGIKAIKNFQNNRPGDVQNTFADTNRIEKWINYKPNTSLKHGIKNFVLWYKKYYGF